MRIPLKCAALFGFCLKENPIYPANIRVPRKVKQLAVVHYRGKSQGVFSYYEQDKDNNWNKVFSCNAWLGKKGIGKKKEGDEKTPTGFYYLEKPFGICKNPGMDKSWHYLKVNSRHYWCSALKGNYRKYYNQLVTSRFKIQGEHLIKYKKFYDYAMFITYNKSGKVGKGSAIFLHCSGNRATAGCVAIEKANLIKLMRRLLPGCHPGIIIY